MYTSFSQVYDRLMDSVDYEYKNGQNILRLKKSI